MGLVQLNAMRLADIFSDDSNFRSYMILCFVSLSFKDNKLTCFSVIDLVVDTSKHHSVLFVEIHSIKIVFTYCFIF